MCHSSIDHVVLWEVFVALHWADDTRLHGSIRRNLWSKPQGQLSVGPIRATVVSQELVPDITPRRIAAPWLCFGGGPQGPARDRNARPIAALAFDWVSRGMSNLT